MIRSARRSRRGARRALAVGYACGAFFLLAGAFAGVRSASLGMPAVGFGRWEGFFHALFSACAPFALMLVCALCGPGVAGQAAVLVWQGFCVGCAPALPQLFVALPVYACTLLYFFTNSSTISLGWFRIKGAGMNGRMSAVSALFGPAAACALLCLAARLAAGLI